MDHDESWSTVVARLREVPSLRIDQVEIGPPATKDDHDVLALMKVAPPPPPILEFFGETNGVKLLWNGELDGEAVQGSINIVMLVQSALRAPAEPDDEPLEGVLWNDEFREDAVKDLKRMSIFEEIAGRSAYLTYHADDPQGRLYLVDNDDIAPLVPDFATVITLLKRYAGMEGLREMLTRDDWEEALRANRLAAHLAAL